VQSDFIEHIAQSEVQDFIFANESIDEHKLSTSGHRVKGISSSILAAQILSRRKVKSKIPTYYHQRGIVYAKSINIEQTSSELTAHYKASLIRQTFASADEVTDLTGGFGIDSFFLSNQFSTVQYVEPENELLNIARHNHAVLSANNIAYNQGTAEDFLPKLKPSPRVFYLDPSRRINGKKAFKFKDSVPNVSNLIPELLAKSQGIVIKASPLVDIAAGISELGSVFQVHVVAVDNDCKEILFFCKRDFKNDVAIHCIDLARDEKFSFSFLAEKEILPTYSAPLDFIYEPNAAILKAGAFKSIAQEVDLAKLDPNTHLYTSTGVKNDFPGRIFKSTALLKNRNDIRVALPEMKANLLLRNFPGTTDELRKSLAIRDGGGEKYLLATTSLKNKIYLLADRLK